MLPLPQKVEFGGNPRYVRGEKPEAGSTLLDTACIRFAQNESSCVTSFLRLGGCSCFPSRPIGSRPGRLALRREVVGTVR